ncbi:hypothetical protein SS50377_21784 [Spironucleus salmonicida]|uniref:Uncharacterized protein n=1 Tax=Spironucleus salmonicida TaxID=348837 RepID=V6LLM8_9EUKA|nr:hypothetical protein SS50377_21784 [Spironucleus salmonicida]|eukprot:EST45467.1 Hypothetical protein SS50377_14621 [Spironucleus salmonicida]
MSNMFDIQLQQESRKIIELGIQTSVRKDYKQLLANVITSTESRQRNDPLILLLSMIILLFALIVFIFIWTQTQANGTFYQ